MKAISSPLTVSLTLTPEQHAWLEENIRLLEHETGRKVSPIAVLSRLMEYGFPRFEQEMLELRLRYQKQRRRLPKLRLIQNR